MSRHGQNGQPASGHCRQQPQGFACHYTAIRRHELILWLGKPMLLAMSLCGQHGIPTTGRALVGRPGQGSRLGAGRVGYREGCRLGPGRFGGQGGELHRDRTTRALASMVKRGVPQVDVAAVFRTRAKVCHGGIPWANTIWKGPDRFWISFISGSAAGPCPQPVVAVAVSVPALPPAVTVFGGSHCGSLLNG